jgi:hypothetical protein
MTKEPIASAPGEAAAECGSDKTLLLRLSLAALILIGAGIGVMIWDDKGVAPKASTMQAHLPETMAVRSPVEPGSVVPK